MAGSFSRIHIHVVLVVKRRECLIHSDWEEELFKYITGIVRKKNQKLLVINGMPDHIHFLIGMKPSCRLSDLVREIKKSTNTFINEMGFTQTKFQWQGGYGAFSCSHYTLSKVITYIENQKTHHRRKTFREEFKKFLAENEVEFKEEFLFDWIDIRSHQDEGHGEARDM